MAQRNTLSEEMLYASQLSYMFSDRSTDVDRLNILNFYLDGYELDTNFFADGHFKDDQTGFEMVALKNSATGEEKIYGVRLD